VARLEQNPRPQTAPRWDGFAKANVLRAGFGRPSWDPL